VVLGRYDSGMPTTQDMQRSMRAVARVGVYIDPVNRERDAYLRGDIDVDELERRVEAILREKVG
jgi:tryptophanase